MTNRSSTFILASLILLAFVGLTMFWSAGPHHGESHNYCISAALQDAACPNAVTAEAAVFHLQTLQSFVSIGGPAWFFSIVLLALAWLTLRTIVPFASNLAPSLAVRRENAGFIFASGGCQRWLSLLEHSPSFSPGRV